MNAKEYLLQARYLDERITSKTQQIASLNDLATKCTSTISDMPRNPNHGGSRMEEAILKIIELEDCLKKDIEKLVDLKKEIMGVIHAIPNVEYQMLLEKRYLCFITWEQIAVDLNYSIPVSYTHLRAHETDSYLVCRLLLEKKKTTKNNKHKNKQKPKKNEK